MSDVLGSPSLSELSEAHLGEAERDFIMSVICRAGEIGLAAISGASLASAVGQETLGGKVIRTAAGIASGAGAFVLHGLAGGFSETEDQHLKAATKYRIQANRLNRTESSSISF